MATGRTAGSLQIVPMLPGHADEVLAIYQAGIDEGNATFETAAPTWETFDAEKLPQHRLAALDDSDGRVLGWVAVARASKWPAYAGVVEHSVYVHPAVRGRGVGLALLTAVIATTEAAGIWTLRSGIFPENTASLALHQRAGFRIIGTLWKRTGDDRIPVLAYSSALLAMSLVALDSGSPRTAAGGALFLVSDAGTRGPVTRGPGCRPRRRTLRWARRPGAAPARPRPPRPRPGRRRRPRRWR
jgi:L-amino acid N-acyltransferase YncA